MISVLVVRSARAARESTAVFMNTGALITAVLACGMLACSDHASGDSAKSGAVATDTVTATAATPRSLPVGTNIEASIQEPISSGHNAKGEHVRAIVSRNVLDDGSRVVIPGGAELALTITQLRPARNAGTVDGVVELQLTSITVGRTIYEPKAGVISVPHAQAVGSARPSERDVTVTPGTPITIKLTLPLKISAN